MRVRNYSGAERSIRDRELRKQRATDRRFNDPLKLFIQHKFPEIFNEYNKLYKSMDDENPGRKNLTTSETFKEWLTANPLKETATTTTTQANLSTLQTPPPRQLLMPQLVLEPVDIQSKVHSEDEQSTDILTQAIRETMEAPQETRPQEIADVDSIIDELLQEQALQDMLERADVNTDEGIELLNTYDEVEMDIELFDYILEVEPFDF